MYSKIFSFYFRLKLSPDDSYFDVNFNPTKILMGHKTLIKVEPITELVSNEDIRYLDVDVRKCRFEDEVPENMVLFKKYSSSGCKFQCMFDFR